MIFTSDDLAATCTPLVGPLREALYIGLAARDEISGSIIGYSECPWFDSHVVRKWARQHLETPGVLPDGYAIDSSVAFSGIHVDAGEVFMRVLKGGPASVPNPGRNTARRRFWSQDHPHVAPRLFPVPLGRPAVNVLLLWRADDDGAVDLWAAVPEGVWPYKGIQRTTLVAPLCDESFDDIPAWVPDEDDFVIEMEIEDDDTQAPGA